MTAVRIEARGLCLGYGGEQVLRDIDLTVHAGEFWFLLGPNGEGKTTFVRALLGLLAPLRGELLLHLPGGDRAQVGFVPQRCELNPSLPTTVGEFVSLGLVGTTVPRGERGARLEEALEAVHLGGLARRSYWALSGGQRQRALIARALIRRPALLLLDEPTTGLDEASQHGLLGLLERLNRDAGLTVLFVTHDLALARRHGSHAVVFHDGRAKSGPIAEVTAAAVPGSLTRADAGRGITGGHA